MRNSICRALVIFVALVILLPAASYGQDRPTGSAVKPTGSAKQAKEATCDGALEIVPSQPLTFMRKRRPAKNTPTSSETKAEKKQAGETQN
jgi:hypothetical protein